MYAFSYFNKKVIEMVCKFFAAYLVIANNSTIDRVIAFVWVYNSI